MLVHQKVSNNVLLVKIEGPGAGIPYIIIDLELKGVKKPLYSSTNQWEKDIYGDIRGVQQSMMGCKKGITINHGIKHWLHGLCFS